MKFINDKTSIELIEIFHSLTAWTFAEFIQIVSFPIMKFRKFIYFLWNLHFFDLSNKFFCISNSITILIYSMCSFFVLKLTRISFKYAITNILRYFRKILFINSWHIADTLINSKGITKYLYQLYLIRKVVFHSFSVFILIRLYASRWFNLMNRFAL